MRPHECISVLDRVKKLFECMKNRRINDARCMCEYNVRYVTNLKAKAAFTAPRTMIIIIIMASIRNFQKQ